MSAGAAATPAGEVHDETAIKAVENAAMSKLSASSTVS